MDCSGLGINDFLCSYWWKSRLGQQKGMYLCACVCFLTQEIEMAWAARALFQVTFLGDCWVPSPGGRELKGRKKLRLGGGSSSPLSSHPQLSSLHRGAQLRTELFG